MRPRLGDVTVELQTRRRPPRGRGGPGAARPGAHEPAGERRAAFAARRHGADPRRAQRATRYGCASPTRARASRRRSVRRCSRPSTVGARARSPPGSGLGLAIARAIVTAHGGRIWIEETTGGGTAMVFDVPIEETVRCEGAGGRRRAADPARPPDEPRGARLRGRDGRDGRGRGRRLGRASSPTWCCSTSGCRTWTAPR